MEKVLVQRDWCELKEKLRYRDADWENKGCNIFSLVFFEFFDFCFDLGRSLFYIFFFQQEQFPITQFQHTGLIYFIHLLDLCIPFVPFR